MHHTPARSRSHAYVHTAIVVSLVPIVFVDAGGVNETTRRNTNQRVIGKIHRTNDDEDLGLVGFSLGTMVTSIFGNPKRTNVHPV